MKKFLFTLFWMVLPVILLCSTALFVEWQIFVRSLRAPDCTIGIIGDSRPACGVDPRYYPGLANFAQVTTQSMVWRAKLPVILRENPQIKKFFIELSPRSFFRMPNASALERARFSRGHIPEIILLDVMKTQAMGGLPADSVARNYIRGVIFPFLRRCVTLSSSSALRGGYNELNGRVRETEWWKNGAKVESGLYSAPSGSSTLLKKDVEDLITFLQEKGIEVALVTVPYWPYERERMYQESDWEFFDKEMAELSSRYHCIYKSYRDTVLADECWADPGHLNKAGAEIFTRIFFQDACEGSSSK